MRSAEQLLVLELVLVGDDVRVGARGRHEVVVADKLPDPRPGDAGQVEEGDAPMAEVVRRERRYARCMTVLTVASSPWRNCAP